MTYLGFLDLRLVVVVLVKLGFDPLEGLDVAEDLLFIGQLHAIRRSLVLQDTEQDQSRKTCEIPDW